jgi:hypothetical protein
MNFVDLDGSADGSSSSINCNSGSGAENTSAAAAGNSYADDFDEDTDTCGVRFADMILHSRGAVGIHDVAGVEGWPSM